MDSFIHSLWAIWLLIALVAAIAEILSPTFGLIFVSGAALVALLTSLTGVSWLLQLVLFGVVLVLSLLFLRPRLNKKFSSTTIPNTRADRLIGLRGYVTEAIDPILGTGRVFVNGEDWASKSVDPLAVGMEVFIDGVEGIVLTVSPAEPS